MRAEDNNSEQEEESADGQGHRQYKPDPSHFDDCQHGPHLARNIFRYFVVEVGICRQVAEGLSDFVEDTVCA